MTHTTIQISAIDTWFFRDSHPFESAGELQSMFPPPMRTLSGAIRTLIGNQHNVDWKDFKNNRDNPLRNIIGSSQEGDLGQLNFQGVWLSKAEKRLYPAPLHLLKKEHEPSLYPLKLSDQGIQCDLGDSIRLPELPSEDARGAKPLENTWIDEETLHQILSGDIPQFSKEHFIHIDDLVEKESRVGIARNNKARTVEKGMLYQIQQARPKDDVTLEIDIKGFPKDSEQTVKSIIRLGGEGRAAVITIKETENLPPPILSNDKLKEAKGIFLYLLTPLQIKDKTQIQPDKWQREIHGISLQLCGAVIGKSIRDGGWNLAKRKPRTDTSLIPAGSIFFCEVEDGNIKKAIEKLHGQQIGEQQNYGYGKIVVGLWN